MIYGFDLRRFVDLANIQELNGAVMSFLICGFLVTTIYLAFANLRTRQVTHDILVDTYVVRGVAVAPVTTTLWPGHLIVLLAGALLGLAVPLVPFEWLDTSEFGRSLTLPYRLEKALADDNTFVVTSYQRKSFQRPGQHEMHKREVITFSAWLHTRNRQPRHVAQTICRTLKRIEPDILKDRTLVIVIKSGADFGIAGKGKQSIAVVGPADLPGYDERGIDFDSLPRATQQMLDDDLARYLPGLSNPQDEMMQRVGSCEF